MKELSMVEMAQLNELYRELGKAYYEGAYEDPLPQLLPLFDQITQMLQEPEPEPQMEEGMKRCPACGEMLPEDAMFCEYCGNRLTAPEPAYVEPEPQVRVCPGCGNILRENARFCGKCGTKVV